MAWPSGWRIWAGSHAGFARLSLAWISTVPKKEKSVEGERQSPMYGQASHTTLHPWIPTLFLGLTALVQAQDIVEVAVSAGFSTLAAAVTAADLVGTLQSEGPFTVFAPTNDAFAALGPATINFLLKDEGIPTLTDVLLYHVVIGAAVASEDLKNKQKIDTALGETVKVKIKKDEFKINDSNVIAADVGADNGIIHVIDGEQFILGMQGRIVYTLCQSVR